MTTDEIQKRQVPERSIEIDEVAQGQVLPVMVRPTRPGMKLVEWGEENRDFIAEILPEAGGILFRGFSVDGVPEFEEFIARVAGGALEYKERSSPRSQVEGNVYTSTDYPADQTIFLHNENSYQAAWPMKIFFYCVTAPASGGETPLADVRKVLERIPDEIRREFERRKWAYVRNFGAGLGLDWKEVFQTDRPEEVDAYCREKGISAEWVDGGSLRTRAVRPAVAEHPETGQDVWFNHATFFHVTTLAPEIREALLELYDVEDLPTHSYFGDGSPIPEETAERLREAYHQETTTFPWREGDVLMLDNMLVAHGRNPFEGDRKVVVGMAEPIGWGELEG